MVRAHWLTQARTGWLTCSLSDRSSPCLPLPELDGLVGQLGDASFVTCLYGIYERRLARLTIANAGHFPPLVAHDRHSAYMLDVPPGPPLGSGARDYPDHTLTVQSGVLLAFFTDGLVGARDHDIDDG